MPDEPRLRALAQKREKAIAVNLVHCFDTMNTYGADPDSLKSRQIVFNKVLAGYTEEQINSAFERYFETGKGLPEPSDILKILEERSYYNRPEYKPFPESENHPGYIDLSDADKEEVDAALEKAKQSLTIEKPDTPPPTNHWFTLNAEQREFYHRSFVESAKKLGRGK